MSKTEFGGPQTVLQSCLLQMTPDMRNAFIEVLEWMAKLPPCEQTKMTPERINNLVLETFALRSKDAPMKGNA